MSVVSGIVGAIAGKKGADAQAKAAKNAAQVQRYMYDQTREDYEPWRATGANALARLGFETGLGPEPAGTTGFQTTPGYQFRVGEGQRGVDNKLASMGLSGSGAAVKATERFRQGIAADEYTNYLNRLAGMAGGGFAAASGTASAGATSAANQGNALIAQGNARASGYQAIGGGIQNALSGIGQGYGYGVGRGWWQ